MKHSISRSDYAKVSNVEETEISTSLDSWSLSSLVFTGSTLKRVASFLLTLLLLLFPAFLWFHASNPSPSVKTNRTVKKRTIESTAVPSNVTTTNLSIGSTSLSLIQSSFNGSIEATPVPPSVITTTSSIGSTPLSLIQSSSNETTEAAAGIPRFHPNATTIPFIGSTPISTMQSSFNETAEPTSVIPRSTAIPIMQSSFKGTIESTAVPSNVTTTIPSITPLSLLQSSFNGIIESTPVPPNVITTIPSISSTPLSIIQSSNDQISRAPHPSDINLEERIIRNQTSLESDVYTFRPTPWSTQLDIPCILLNLTWKNSPQCGSNMINPWKLLITGTGRSGTKGTSECLRKIGLEFSHDEGTMHTFALGAVSWPTLFRFSNFGVDTRKRGFTKIILMTREPLGSISSRAAKIESLHNIDCCVKVEYTEKSLKLQDIKAKKNQRIWSHANSNTRSALILSLEYWVLWNSFASYIADGHIQVEHRSETLFDYMSKFDVTSRNDTKLERDFFNCSEGSQHANSEHVAPHKQKWWGQLDYLNPEYSLMAKILAKKFGYDVKVDTEASFECGLVLPGKKQYQWELRKKRRPNSSFPPWKKKLFELRWACWLPDEQKEKLKSI